MKYAAHTINMYFSTIKYKNGPTFSGTLRLILIVLLIINGTVGIRSRKECDNLSNNSHCECTPSIDEFDIQCSSKVSNANIIIRYKLNSYVTIYCEKFEVNDYILLPQINIGNIPTVQFKHCPLPGSEPIIHLIEYLGITQTTALLYENNNISTNFTKQHLSGLKGLERLHIKLKKSITLPVKLLEDFSNLTYLELRLFETEFPYDFFNPLKNLKFLSLGDNELKSLQPGIFRNLNKLKSLNLWSNQLHNMSKGVFEGVSAITDLDLSGNGIETFQTDIFSLLPNLNNLALNANNFKYLPNKLFEFNQQLSEMNLINNRAKLKNLPLKFLANLSNLKEVRITCALENIPDDVFMNSTALTDLILVENALIDLPETLFKDQHNLRNLDLSQNQLVELSEQLFSSLRFLEVLKLSHNQILTISSELLSSLNNLKELHMDNNRLKSIDSHAFVNTLNIRYMNLENNDINFEDENDYTFDVHAISPFRYLTKLQILNLRNNSIGFIYSDWPLLFIDLKLLDISYNAIKSLDYSDLQFVTLNKANINLTYNQIEVIDFQDIDLLDFFEKREKLYFNLNNNPLRCDCNLISFVKYLRGEIGKNLTDKIEFATKELACANPTEFGGENIHTVDPMKLICPFEDGCPYECGCWVRSYDLVLEVKCGGSNLTQLPALPSLNKTKLKATELFIENNTISKLNNMNNRSFSYETITKIYASGNQITNIDVNQLPAKLSFLDLRSNKLQTLNEDVMEALNKSNSLKEILLSENPWNCDCDKNELLQFIKNNKRINDYSEMHCEVYQEIKKFEDLSVAEICRREKMIPIIIAMVISIIGIILGISAALYYKYQKEIKIWLYSKNLCLWFVTEDELDKNKIYDAFVSYSDKDSKFIENYLRPNLEENGPIKYKLCLHERDWKTGELIPDQIVNSVNNSRRTIILLSQNFVKSEWAVIEFRTAHMAALTEKRARVIVIIYGEIGNIELLDDDLKAYLKMNTYLKWNDPWFWSKLRYAMPHKGKWMSDLVKTPIKNNIILKIDKETLNYSNNLSTEKIC